MGHTSEILVPLEHEKWQPCEHEGCELLAMQIPSAFRMPCAKREKFFGREIPVNDSAEDPWAGTGLDGKGEPDLKYRSKRVQLDLGSKSTAKKKTTDYAQFLAEL